MAILRESVDLVIDGSDFYRSIQKAPRTKLKNGWCDFRLLVEQQAREIASRFVLGSILYFDPRANSRTEDSYGSAQRRELWLGRLKNLNVSELLVSTRLDYQNRKGDPDYFPNATHQLMAALAHREYSANVLVLSTQESPLFSCLEHLQDSRGFSKGLLLPPGESEFHWRACPLGHACDNDQLLVWKMKALRWPQITRPQRAVTHDYAFDDHPRIDCPDLQRVISRLRNRQRNRDAAHSIAHRLLPVLLSVVLELVNDGTRSIVH